MRLGLRHEHTGIHPDHSADSHFDRVIYRLCSFGLVGNMSERTEIETLRAQLAEAKQYCTMAGDDLRAMRKVLRSREDALIGANIENESLRKELADAKAQLNISLILTRKQTEDMTQLFTQCRAAKAENEALRKDAGRNCTWKQDDDLYTPDTWDGACGAKWTFTDGGPVENDMHHCPNCGGKVAIAAAQVKS